MIRFILVTLCFGLFALHAVAVELVHGELLIPATGEAVGGLVAWENAA